MWPEIIPFHAAFAMNALSRRFVNAATFPFIYYWNCLGLLCCPSFVNCSLVKYVREHWTTYSMSCKYVKWTSLFLFDRSTFFDNKKSSKLVKDVDCLSDWEVSNGGESEGRGSNMWRRRTLHVYMGIMSSWFNALWWRLERVKEEWQEGKEMKKTIWRIYFYYN